MSNANEFRLGNYAYYRECEGNLKIGRITSLRKNGDKFSIELDNHWRFDSLIPFTEEWLEKFGFVKTDQIADDSEDTMSGAIIWELDYHSVFQKEGKFYYIMDLFTDDYGFHYRYKEIPYVHKLQNVHYELIEDELNQKGISFSKTT